MPERLFLVLRLVFVEHRQLALELGGKPVIEFAANLIHPDPFE